MTRLTKRFAEIHQPVLRGLLQHHRALLVGSVRHHFPIRTSQRRTFVHGLRIHSRRLWSDRSGLLNGRNGLHVRKKPCLSAIEPTLTPCRDPTVGAQYRWSANFAPFAPRFWGLLQGTGDTLNAWLECSHASRMADCVCLDHQLCRTSCNHFQHYYRPRCLQLRDLSA